MNRVWVAGGRVEARRGPFESGPPAAALDLSVLRSGLASPVTPFVEATRAAAPPRQLAAGAGSDGREGADETMALPRGALVTASGGPPGVRVAFVPELSVDPYAALVVDLEVKGPSADVLRRYGIPTTDALSALHAAQAERCALDGALAARFAERRAHFLRFARKA